MSNTLIVEVLPTAFIISFLLWKIETNLRKVQAAHNACDMYEGAKEKTLPALPKRVSLEQQGLQESLSPVFGRRQRLRKSIAK